MMGALSRKVRDTALPGAFNAEDEQEKGRYVDFLPVRVVTASGQEVDGLRLNEDGFTIQLRDLENRLHSFRKSEIKIMEKGFARSFMPSFAGVFKPGEIEDLVAFLANLKGKP